MKMNVDFVRRRNPQGRYINLLNIIIKNDNARHFSPECSEVEYCFMLEFVKQALKYSENYNFLVFGNDIFFAVHPRGYVDISTSIEPKHWTKIRSEFL